MNGRVTYAVVISGRLGAGGRAARPGRAVDRAERHPGGRSGAGEARPDDGVTVHFLPRRGEGDGDRSGHYADGRPGGAALRRRPPVQLRRLRLTGAGAAVRPERLRRDLAWTVRVRPQADGRQLHDRGPQQRLHPRRCASGDCRVGQGLPVGDGRVRRDAHLGHLVRAHDRTRHPRRAAGGRRSLGRRPKPPKARPGRKSGAAKDGSAGPTGARKPSRGRTRRSARPTPATASAR